MQKKLFLQLINCCGHSEDLKDKKELNLTQQMDRNRSLDHRGANSAWLDALGHDDAPVKFW